MAESSRWQSSSAASEAFLRDIAAFSQDALHRMGLPIEGSPNGEDDLLCGGLVLHYTVDAHAQSTARWLCDRTSNASAHFIIAAERLIAQPHKGPSPAYDLDASIVQLRPIEHGAWHATWANAWGLGIEICNSGEIRTDAAGTPHTFRAAQGWQPAAGLSAAHPLARGQRLFCGYSDAQLDSLKLLLYALCRRTGLSPDDIFGHDMVQGAQTPHSGGHDKRDVGGLDLAWLRQSLLAMGDDELRRQYDRSDAPAYRPPTFCQQQAFDPCGLDPQRDWVMRGRVRNGDAWALRALLRDLGYSLDPQGPAPCDAEARQIKVFQHMMGLVPDGLAGPLTRIALCKRHADRHGAAPTITLGQKDA